ncbi:MAG: C4-dicarboxylate ABC transporter substrate-binding protein [Deltaproteobacteria bacterium]|nr:MAG: C4-dicarboxylate ABC transporter substrate-binding protein [Deltaproteobacteria bacterium]
MKRKCLRVLVLALVVMMACSSAVMAKKKNPLAKWKSTVDMSGAKYTMKVSNISHPVIEGVAAGYRIRNSLWEKSNGQIALKYYPLHQLGGEVEVLNMLKTNTVQGMMCSSVAVTNLAPRMGIINLPFLINSFDKLDKYIASPLWQHFLDGMKHQGIMGVDITGYGNYGWATVDPVKTLADAKDVKFRIAEAAVQRSLYKEWGLHPVVMPWPDVSISLKQKVITGLDHTPTVCNITKKFEVCKNFTRINYAQGLFIFLMNEKFYNSLPSDLQKVLLDTIHEECAKTRVLTRQQEIDQIAKAKANGIKFYQLPAKDMETLRVKGETVHKEWAKKIGPDYLKKVQDLMGYKRVLDY